MPKKRHSPEQIIGKLRDADAMLAAGKTIGQVCQSLEVSEQTFHRWRAQYGGMKAEEAKRLKHVEEENKRLEEAFGRGGTRQGDPQGGPPGKLLSPARRRATVGHVQRQLGVSERRACRALGQCRSSQRYQPLDDEEEKRLVQEMLALVGEHPRYGYRRIWALLRKAGWTVNRKRIYRLWRQEGLKVPQKQHKKRRFGA